MSLPGHATPEGTVAYAARFTGRAGLTAGFAFAPAGSTGLVVSRLGFGGYRVDDRTRDHRAALERSLASGSNLIDTSTNYTDGASERLVGAVLRELTRGGRLAREEVVVVSKIGYVQGENLALAQAREAAGRPFPEMVRYMDGCWHCIHPEFLDDQLGRSLERLDLRALDVCLLHNPEYFFSDALHRGQGRDPASLARLRDEFYRRLREAFRFFEAQAEEGRLVWYGVSSNTVAKPDGEPDSTSLARMLEAAREAGGPGHRFRVLQLPMNLVEAGGVLDPTEGGETVLELAARERLGVLVNRPLNAVVGAVMLRLAGVPVPPAVVGLDGQRVVLAALEAEFRREIAPEVRVGEGSLEPGELFRWSDELPGVLRQVKGLDHWRQVEAHMLLPAVNQVVRELDRALRGDAAARWRDWRARYLPELQRFVEELRRQAALRSRAAVEAIERAIDPLLPDDRREESLSRKAIWVLASTPGVTAVLNGMRTPAYVEDSMGVLRWEPLADARRAYEAVRAVGQRQG